MILLFALPLLRLLSWPEPRTPGRATPTQWLWAGCVGSLIALAVLMAPTQIGEKIRQGAAWRAGGTDGYVAIFKQALDKHAHGGAVYAVSPSLVSIFPAVNYAGVDWSSRFSALYLPAAVARQRWDDPAVPDRLTTERADAIERFIRDAVIEDLERRPPELIMIDRVKRRKVFAGIPFDFLEYFLQDPRFAKIWSDYSPIGRVGRFEAAVRR